MQFQGLKIIQADGGYKFSTDSVLLANFGKAKPNDIYVDLCSGSGVVAILFSCKNKIKKSYAVEIQPRLADMAQRSVEENGLENKITVLNEDLSEVHKTLGYESVDVITVNPPYNVAGDVSETTEIAIATHEIKTNLEKIVLSSSKLLKYGGHIGYAINPKYWKMGYGKELLKLGLEKARELIEEKNILLTCDNDNIGSYKIIE